MSARRFDAIDVSLIRQINALARPGAINLGIGEPNIEPDEEFRNLARRAASEASFRYSANAGALSLRERIAAACGAGIDPEAELCVTAGTEEALFAICQAFVDPGDEVLIPDPGFVSYEALVRLAGGIPVRYELEPERWSFDAETVISRCTGRTRAIFLNSPSNPTGAVADRQTLGSIANMAAERGILLIADEVYREIYYRDVPSTLAGAGPNIIVANGFSKSHAMTGLRLGWVTAPQPLMKTIVKAHQYITTCASTFSQKLGEMIFDSEDFNRRWLDGMRARFAVRRATALEAVRGILEVEVADPDGAFYLFVPVPACSSLDLARELATEADVIAIPGIAFGPGGEGFLRLSYASEPELIAEGVHRIARHLERDRSC